ncbi:four helix bundle protein [Notoacmeibacter sp. MSK16QG-6]|uniref:four helix bundle protein n=1 Tax=Notoacmeibacter sp. MSK16QG-6 TaxID=2957982 RepID=UPI00209C8CBF|nr:four helix bundle protein [Notoacmeibacter sp. MSK16QG-6]MCP1197940.1 four helix bundle protein [Notoacmeibacter sp. MSK16QG-6]
MSDVIRSYRDLRVWQKAMDLAEAVYKATEHFPDGERFGMTSQMRRAAVSVPANIAEGFGRESSGVFVQFLRTSQGSLKELETHCLLAKRVDLLEKPVADELLCRADDIGRMLGGLIRRVAERSRNTNDGQRITSDSAPEARDD